jgi:hypothetical protein
MMGDMMLRMMENMGLERMTPTMMNASFYQMGKERRKFMMTLC